MKIRKGFVSNSSSSSFCICGVSFEQSDEDKLKQVLSLIPIDTEQFNVQGCDCDIDRKAMVEKNWTFCPKCQSLLFKEPNKQDMFDQLNKECEKLDLIFFSDGYVCYFGQNIGDENILIEMGKMEKTNNKLKELLGKNIVVKLHHGEYDY